MRPRARHRRKLHLPAAPRDHRCVILAVDPSQASSGYAILIDGRPIEWGAVPATDFVRVAAVVARAVRLGARTRRHVVLVAEEWGRGGRLSSARTSGGLGAACGAWKGMALAARVEGHRIVPGRILRVHASRWRSRFALSSRLGTEGLKRAAVRLARARLGVALRDDQHDAAEALLIGLWAARAGEVGAALPRRPPR